MARIIGTATQGGADAFVEAEIQTSLEGQQTNAFSVKEILLEFDTTQLFGVASGAVDIEVALSRRTKAAMPNIQDTDVIKKWHWGQGEPTAVGQILNPEGGQNIFSWRPAVETIIVEDPLFFDLDSTNTGLTLTCLMVIEFEIVQISSLDRLTLLTLSL